MTWRCLWGSFWCIKWQTLWRGYQLWNFYGVCQIKVLWVRNELRAPLLEFLQVGYSSMNQGVSPICPWGEEQPGNIIIMKDNPGYWWEHGKVNSSIFRALYPTLPCTWPCSQHILNIYTRAPVKTTPCRGKLRFRPWERTFDSMDDLRLSAEELDSTSTAPLFFLLRRPIDRSYLPRGSEWGLRGRLERLLELPIAAFPSHIYGVFGWDSAAVATRPRGWQSVALWMPATKGTASALCQWSSIGNFLERQSCHRIQGFGDYYKWIGYSLLMVPILAPLGDSRGVIFKIWEKYLEKVLYASYAWVVSP